MNTFLKNIIKPFQYIYRTCNFLRKLLLNVFFLFLLLGAVLFIYSKKNNSIILHYPNNNSALIINLNEKIKEKEISTQYTYNRFHDWLSFLYHDKTQNSVFEIVKKIRQAKKDPKITGLILKIYKNFTGNPIVLSYIGKALNEFKKSGKSVYALGSQYTQNQYYLASFANKIFLLPHGSVKLNGFSKKQLYFKKLLNICKVHIHVFRVGKYKSAVEPFLRNGPSNFHKTLHINWMDTIWQEYLETIARNRRTTKKDIFPTPQSIIHALKKSKNTLTKISLKHHLIDKIDTYLNIYKYFIKKFGMDKKNKKLNSIDINNYYIKQKKPSKLPNKIAIILANGIIDNNINNLKAMNISSIMSQIQKAKNDPNIRAIVLRINSPGGNANISELIRKKLLELKNNAKPIVISMGNVTASGGYWIAMGGSYIIAHPTTITGSIGIFSVLQTFEKTLSTLGMYNIRLEKSPINNIHSYNDLTLEDKKITQINICKGYKKFIKLIAHSRNKSVQQINEIAQGKVWIGKNAKNVGLIDQLGDFDSAIIKAAKLAKLKKYEVIWFKNKTNFLANFMYPIYNSIFQLVKNISSTYIPAVILKKVFFITTTLKSITQYLENNQYLSLCLDYQINY